MPLPRQLAEFNRHVTNPLVRLFAARVPPLIMLEHRGRRSGRRYRTPLMGFFAGDELIIALTYGLGTEWMKNLEAAAGGEVVSRGRRLTVGAPMVGHGIAKAPGIPWPIRTFLGLVKIDDYLRVPLLPALAERTPD